MLLNWSHRTEPESIVLSISLNIHLHREIYRVKVVYIDEAHIPRSAQFHCKNVFLLRTLNGAENELY
jgi:hypothetical protein